jgi:hypothetical protein
LDASGRTGNLTPFVLSHGSTIGAFQPQEPLAEVPNSVLPAKAEIQEILTKPGFPAGPVGQSRACKMRPPASVTVHRTWSRWCIFDGTSESIFVNRKVQHCEKRPIVFSVRQQMLFPYPSFFLTCQFMNDRSKFVSDLPEDNLSAPLGDKDLVILAISLAVGRTLIRFGHRILLRCAHSSNHREDSTPATLKALQVSLVEPVAYQFELAGYAISTETFPLNSTALVDPFPGFHVEGVDRSRTLPQSPLSLNRNTTLIYL